MTWGISLKKQIEGQMDFLDLLSETHFLEEFPQFIECSSCWCYDCRHNENNEGVPERFCGEVKACPSLNSVWKDRKQISVGSALIRMGVR